MNLASITPVKQIPFALRNFDQLPGCAYVRQRVVELLFSISSANVWRRVREGELPQQHTFAANGLQYWSVGQLRRVLR